MPPAPVTTILIVEWISDCLPVACHPWGDERRAGDVGGDTAGISCEKRAGGDGRVCTDEEIREDRLAGASGPAVDGVRMTGEEGRRVVNFLDGRHGRERVVECLDARDPRRDLCQDDAVEDDRAALCGLGS